MTRLARIAVPDRPHHAAQRLNQREGVLVEDGDHEIYRDTERPKPRIDPSMSNGERTVR